MMVGKFTKPVAGAAAKPPVRKSRYAGIELKDDRDPMLDVGEHRVRIRLCEETQNPGTLKESVKVRIVPVSLVGNEYVEDEKQRLMLFMRTTAGLAEFKRCVAKSAGFEDYPEYDAFDPPETGWFLEACLGNTCEEARAFSDAGLSIIGRLVDVTVRRGKDAIDPKSKQPTGDWYRQYTFDVVPDEEQDQAASCPALLAAAAEATP